jgi:hypothetical protein
VTRPDPIIALLGAVALAWAAFYAIGFGPVFLQRPLWNDEVFSAFVTGPGMAGHLHHITSDVHPPLYYALLSLFRRLPGLMDAGHAGRFLNLVFLPPLLAGLWRLTAMRGGFVGLTAACLILGSGYFAAYLIELRSYFALMAVATMVTCFLLVAPTPRAEAWGRGAVVVLSLLHFFGTAYACAVLTVRIALRWRQGASARADLHTLAAVLALFGVWFLIAFGTYTRYLTEGFWIELHWGVILGLLEYGTLAIVLALVGVALAITQRADLSEIAPLAWAVGLTLAGVVLISLVEPVITARNLIVLLPPVAVIAALAWAHAGPALARWMLAAVALGSLVLAPLSTRFWQPLDNVDFIVAEVFTDACAGVPVYAPVTWAPFSQTPQSYGVPDRPILTDPAAIAALAAGPDWPEACSALGYLRRSRVEPDRVIAAFEAAGLDVETRIAPARGARNTPNRGGIVFYLRAPD